MCIRDRLKTTPKILAPIAGKTFLDWLLLWIESWGMNISKENILLSTCIGHEKIRNYCIEKNLNLDCIKETSPLGTFGALAYVATRKISKNYLILNGDTIFKADINQIYSQFKKYVEPKPLIILKKSFNNSRYGGFKKIKDGWIFTNEKTQHISLGSFFIRYEDLKKRWLSNTNIPFESQKINESDRETMIDKNLFGMSPVSAAILKEETPFIDIGIPESFKNAQTFIPKIILD